MKWDFWGPTQPHQESPTLRPHSLGMVGRVEVFVHTQDLTQPLGQILGQRSATALLKAVQRKNLYPDNHNWNHFINQILFHSVQTKPSQL